MLETDEPHEATSVNIVKTPRISGLRFVPMCVPLMVFYMYAEQSWAVVVDVLP